MSPFAKLTPDLRSTETTLFFEAATPLTTSTSTSITEAATLIFTTTNTVFIEAATPLAVDDYNFGTLVRKDCEGDYSEENSIFGELSSAHWEREEPS